MPIQVSKLIEGRGRPVCVRPDDPVIMALTLMLEHDYSQLPVVEPGEGIGTASALVTYEEILRSVRYLKADLEDLKVRNAMVKAPVHYVEDDLFDILDDSKKANAVLILDSSSDELIGIVTGFDLAEYFRRRFEDLMRVEDVELTVRDFILAAYARPDGSIDESGLEFAIKMTARNPVKNGKVKAFSDLTFGDYLYLLAHPATWTPLESRFGLKQESVGELLDGVRQTRNELAHFRGEITAANRDRLRYAADWITRRWDEHQGNMGSRQAGTADAQRPTSNGVDVVAVDVSTPTLGQPTIEIRPVGFSDRPEQSGGRYAALADWLQSQPGNIDQVPLTFNQIEEIIKSDLPASARAHRAWWANDSVGHGHSQLWLEAGWRTTYINLNEGRVTFARIREREKAYIAFFSKLLEELRITNRMPLRDVSPDGTSWVVLQTVPHSSGFMANFGFSFTRNRRMRTELYLDLNDQAKTKAVFDRLYEQRGVFEAAAGPIDWERLDTARASRIAQYHDGHILDEEGHAALRAWAVTTMPLFYRTLVAPAERAIKEVRQA